jgi:hypothetical protein
MNIQDIPRRGGITEGDEGDFHDYFMLVIDSLGCGSKNCVVTGNRLLGERKGCECYGSPDILREVIGLYRAEFKERR